VERMWSFCASTEQFPLSIQRCVLPFLLPMASTSAQWNTGDGATNHTSRPLVKIPKGTSYKTILDIGAGGLRALISSMVIIELERSIKTYILYHPHYLPPESGISSIEDFDINLVDYFDCMSGNSAGAWSTMYLASRGGKGASREVLDRPDIVERYGVIPTGGAEGLRVFYKEFGAMIYPQEAINTSAGMVGDLTNPFAPGVATPLYPLEGLIGALGAFYGDATLDDLDTSVLVAAYDLVVGTTVFFVQNAFGEFPASSSARLVARSSPKQGTSDGRFFPDLVFDESKNYFLKDVGAASGSVPVVNPAMPVTPVGGEDVEFLCIDGAIPIEHSALRAAFFVANENGLSGLQSIAILSLGNGGDSGDQLPLANAGLAGWLAESDLFSLHILSGHQAVNSLLDYFYYANPNTKPDQYLRIQVSAPASSEEEMALRVFDRADLADFYEEVGVRIAEAHRSSIDLFVREFIFG